MISRKVTIHFFLSGWHSQTLWWDFCCPYLWAVLDVVSLVETKMAQVVGRWSLAGLSGFWGEGYVGEMFSEGAQAVYYVIKGAIGRGTLIEAAAQCLPKGKRKKWNRVIFSGNRSKIHIWNCTAFAGDHMTGLNNNAIFLLKNPEKGWKAVSDYASLHKNHFSDLLQKLVTGNQGSYLEV